MVLSSERGDIGSFSFSLKRYSRRVGMGEGTEWREIHADGLSS